MKINFKILTIIILSMASLTIYSCDGSAVSTSKQGESDGHGAGHGEGESEEHEHGESSHVDLTADQIKQIGLNFTTIKMQYLADAQTLTGALAVPNDHKAFLTALFGGVLKGLRVQPGDQVKQGQVIGTMSNPALFPLQQQLQTVQNQLQVTQLEVARQQELVNGNAAPLKRLQQVEMELANLQEQRKSLRQQLQEFGASQQYSSTVYLKAPIAGTVSKIFSQIGSNVDLNSPILEIVDNSELHLDLFIYEKDLANVKKGQQLTFSTVNNPEQQYQAEIILIGGAFEANSSAIAVHAKVMGVKTNLLEGMQVMASLNLGSKQVPAVPNESIVSYQGKDYIFIAKSNAIAKNSTEDAKLNEQEFERLEVAKGISKGGFTAITPVKELDPATKVVQKGAFFLIAKMTNAGEHSH